MKIISMTVCALAFMAVCSFNLEAKHHHRHGDKHHHHHSVNINVSTPTVYAVQPQYVIQEYRPVTYPATTYVVYPTAAPVYDAYISFGWFIF